MAVLAVWILFSHNLVIQSLYGKLDQEIKWFRKFMLRKVVGRSSRTTGGFFSSGYLQNPLRVNSASESVKTGSVRRSSGAQTAMLIHSPLDHKLMLIFAYDK